MHIVIFYQYYLINGRQGGSRFNEMARMWAEAGHDVTVIAGDVNYATGERPLRCKGRWITSEHDGKVRVLCCYVPGSYGKSYAGRALGYLGFTLSSLTAIPRLRRPDIVIATSPPLVVCVPGWVAARVRLTRIPFVFEVRDLWPESAITTGVLQPNSVVARLLYRLERWACRSADHVSVLTPAFREDLIRRDLVPPQRISVIPNGADLDLFSPGPRDNEVRREFEWGERTVVMYAGAHGRANALSQLVRAAERLRGREDILIACVGDGPERSALESEERALHLRNIVFYGSQPKPRMPEFVRGCDIGAAVLQRNPTFRTVYPNT